MSREAEIDRLQGSFEGVVRALGLLRPDTTPCGQPMSITEAHAIAELERAGSLTQNGLALALGLQKSTISRLVDQLVDRDLAVRTPNPADQRSVLVSLTTGGADRARRLADARRALFATLLERLEPADRRIVVEGLTRLSEAAREPI
jgi:DNA-binding MarR family transcriptional regulator